MAVNGGISVVGRGIFFLWGGNSDRCVKPVGLWGTFLQYASQEGEHPSTIDHKPRDGGRDPRESWGTVVSAV